MTLPRCGRRARGTKRWCGVSLICGAVAIGAVGCTSRDAVVERRAADGSTLQPVSLPDLSKFSPSVQSQIREQHAALLAKLADRAVPTQELAKSYGECTVIAREALEAGAGMRALERLRTAYAKDPASPA